MSYPWKRKLVTDQRQLTTIGLEAVPGKRVRNQIGRQVSARQYSDEKIIGTTLEAMVCESEGQTERVVEVYFEHHLADPIEVALADLRLPEFTKVAVLLSVELSNGGNHTVAQISLPNGEAASLVLSASW